MYRPLPYSPERDSIWGDTYNGVPTPNAIVDHGYPTRFHGPVLNEWAFTGKYLPAIYGRAPFAGLGFTQVGDKVVDEPPVPGGGGGGEASPSWWAGLATWQKVAVVGVPVALVAAYFLLGKKRPAYAANKLRAGYAKRARAARQAARTPEAREKIRASKKRRRARRNSGKERTAFGIGDLVRWKGVTAMVVDVHGYPVKTVDLRWTVSGTPGSRNEVSGHKRGVSVEQIAPHAKPNPKRGRRTVKKQRSGFHGRKATRARRSSQPDEMAHYRAAEAAYGGDDEDRYIGPWDSHPSRW